MMQKLLFAVSALFAGHVVANVPLTLDAIEARIKSETLMRNLWNLNHIANDNGGNRASGSPGYAESVEYVTQRAGRFKGRITYELQPFNMTFYTVSGISLTGPAGESVYVISPTANINGVVTGQLADTSVNDTAGSMCTEADWAAVDVRGKIALVKRGLCGFINKLEFAKSHGAIAVVMYNSPQSGTNYAGPDLGSPPIDSFVPVGIIPLELGQAWKARLVAGETLTVTLSVKSSVEDRPVNNVIAETTAGDPNNVIMLGAHLDSVKEGPGINDDGSGVTALMEIMEAFSKYVGYKNKVRFGWWGGEEEGLIGSLHYASTLSAADAAKIKFYFNYDMIGSIKPEYWVYGLTDADRFGGEEINRYITAQGKVAIPYGAWTNDSDYVGFLNRGIPVSGIFTGADEPWDPCYHSACDTRENINVEALTINSKAAARAAAKLALSLDGLPAAARKRDLWAEESPAAAVTGRHVRQTRAAALASAKGKKPVVT